MSSMLETLWPVFLAEVGEKLDALESLLGEPADTDVDALFREFHTLKSSFAMVDFQVMVDLAHACEDVLHAVRKHGGGIDQGIRRLLTEAVDWMKQQMAEASPGQYPQQPNESLLGRLSPHRASVQEAAAEGEAPAPLPAAPEPEPVAVDALAEEKEALAIDTLRISSQALDHLVTNVGQLAQQEGALSHVIQHDSLALALAQARQAVQALANGQASDAERTALEQLLARFARYRQELLQREAEIQVAISSIQQDVLDLRVIPLSTIFNRLPRIVRKKAGDAGRHVQLVIDGGEVAIDKGMIEVIAEPLIHLLHNAVVHGIEPPAERRETGKPEVAVIDIRATELGSLLRIEVSDDGRGIDYRQVRQKAIAKGFARADDTQDEPAYWLNYLFAQGLNADNQHRITGLDTVRNNLAGIGGSIEVDSEPGRGTRFVMYLPVTVAIQSVMVVRARAQTFAIPTRTVQEIVTVSRGALQVLNHQAALLLRENMLPVYHLGHLLQLPAESAAPAADALVLLVLQHDTHSLALAVDSIIGRQELFLRDIHADLRAIPGVGGVSLLGNGEVVIILDNENLFSLARRKPCRREELV